MTSMVRMTKATLARMGGGGDDDDDEDGEGDAGEDGRWRRRRRGWRGGDGDDEDGEKAAVMARTGSDTGDARGGDGGPYVVSGDVVGGQWPRAGAASSTRCLSPSSTPTSSRTEAQVDGANPVSRVLATTLASGGYWTPQPSRVAPASLISGSSVSACSSCKIGTSLSYLAYAPSWRPHCRCCCCPRLAPTSCATKHRGRRRGEKKGKGI